MTGETQTPRTVTATLRRWARTFLDKSTLGRKALSRFRQRDRNRLARRHGDAKSFFTHVYETNLWGDKESVSGPDSTVAYTEKMRHEFEALLKQYNVKRIFDAPCGDYNWFRLVSLAPGSTYVGGDIVAQLIERNNEAYGNDTTRFCVVDMSKDAFPAADLWLCRNGLFHLSFADILSALTSFVASGTPYLLATTHPRRETNEDIPSGSYRSLNLEAAPFNLPAPIARIDDWAEGWDYR